MEPDFLSKRFNLDPIAEIHLDRPPIVKVLTQVQFSYTPELVTDDNEQKLAKALYRYPVRRWNQSLSLNPGAGTTDPKPVITRVFANDNQSWIVTVTNSTVSLETRDYDSRDDFCNRILEVLIAVGDVCTPPLVDRVGVRYVDRILESENLKHLDKLVSPRLEVLHGAVDPPLVVEFSVSDTVIQITESEKLRIRSGLLPPNMGFDPILEPVAESSWILDLDMFTAKGGFSFDPPVLASRIRGYAENIYKFFRWATTEQFQETFKNDSSRRE